MAYSGPTLSMGLRVEFENATGNPYYDSFLDNFPFWIWKLMECPSSRLRETLITLQRDHSYNVGHHMLPLICNININNFIISAFVVYFRPTEKFTLSTTCWAGSQILLVNYGNGKNERNAEKKSEMQIDFIFPSKTHRGKF